MLAQIMWNGMVSQPGNMKMKSRLASANIVHTVSITPGGQGHPKRGSQRGSRETVNACGTVSDSLSHSLGDELIALTPYGLDQVETELGANPPDAHVHHIGAGVEVVAPDGSEQAALGDRVTGVVGELAQQQELKAGQRHWPLPDVRDQFPDVKGDVAGPDDLAGRVAGGLGRGQRRHERARFGVLLRPVVMVRLGAEPDADACQELSEGERLGQVIL